MCSSDLVEVVHRRDRPGGADLQGRRRQPLPRAQELRARDEDPDAQHRHDASRHPQAARRGNRQRQGQHGLAASDHERREPGRVRRDARRRGLGGPDAADAWDVLGKKHHDFEVQFTAAIGTNMKLTLEYFDQVFKNSTFVFDAVKTVFQTVVVVASDVAFVIKTIADEIENVIKVSKTMATEGIAAAGKIRDEYLERKAKERQELDFFQQRIMGMGVRSPDDPRRLDKPAKAKAQGALRTVEESAEAKRQRQMLEMAKLISVEYERHLQFNYENLKVQGQMAFMTENEKKLQEAINKVADDVDKKLNEIQKKREEAAAHGASRKVLDELDAQAEAVRKLGEQYKTLTEIEMKQQIAEQQTFSYGWNKAFKQYVEEIGRAHV